MKASPWIAAVAAALALGVGTAGADPHWNGPHAGYEHSRPGFDHMDARFGHNHYYPARGYYFNDIPRERFVVRGGYYYSGGIWYARRGPGFVVVGPPVGVYVPVLPAFYTTVWFGGVPYYYANDTYYQWAAGENQYVVVTPPGDDSAAQTQPAQPPQSTSGEDLFIYPKNGQSEEQQSTDKYECHKWAHDQSGFDPTQSGGGVAPEQNASARAAYNRAMGACLEGRGYTVK
jgi:hypothetical protein